MVEVFLFLLILFVCFAAFEVWRLLEEDWDLGNFTDSQQDDDDEDHKIL